MRRLIAEYKAEMSRTRAIVDPYMAEKGLTYGDIFLSARLSHKWSALKHALENVFQHPCLRETSDFQKSRFRTYEVIVKEKHGTA